MPTPAPFRARAGFSLLEVTIALAILISTVLLVVGQFANVANLQRSTEQSAAIDRVLQGLVERINAVDFTHLGTTRAPWSVASYELTTIASRPPMQLRAASSTYDLQALGLVPTSGLVDDLRIYFEYYRAVDFTNGAGVLQEGLLDEPLPSTAVDIPPPTTYEAPDKETAWRMVCYTDPMQPAAGVRPIFRLSPWTPSDTTETNSPGLVSGLLGPSDPLLIRLIAVWDGGAQRRELFTARSP